MGLFSLTIPKTFESLKTDIHCHLLPRVDDGSRDVEETVECLKTMASVGFKKVCLTPHFQANYPNKEEDIQHRFELLKKELQKYEGLPEVSVISGEYRFDPNFARIPGVDTVLPLPGNTLLCEFSLHAANYDAKPLFDQYQQKGYKLILAHPERYPYLGLHSLELKKMKDSGIFFQVNLLSLIGFYGDGPMEKGFSFIENGLVEYLGTDTHNTRYANALVEAARDRRVRKMMKSHTFLNSKM